MTWIGKTADGETNLERVFGLLPEAHERFRTRYALLWDPAVSSPVILELCRLRIATRLGCAAESRIRYLDVLDAGLDEAKIAALPAYSTSPLYDDVERSCIAFAEQYVLDPHCWKKMESGAITFAPADLSNHRTPCNSHDGSSKEWCAATANAL